VDTLFTGGRSGIVGDKEKGIFKKILMGAFQEGILEELPQSMQEQIAQNLSLNKPIGDDVFEAGAMGMLAGFAQSTGAQIAGSTMQKIKNELDPINQTIKKTAEETLAGELNAIGGWDNGKPVEVIAPAPITPEPIIATPPIQETVQPPVVEPSPVQEMVVPEEKLTELTPTEEVKPEVPVATQPEGKQPLSFEEFANSKKEGRFDIVGSRLRGDNKPTSDYDVITTLTKDEQTRLNSNERNGYPVLPKDVIDRVNSGKDDVFIQDGNKLYKVEKHPEEKGEFWLERVSQKESNILAGGKKDQNLPFISREETLKRNYDNYLKEKATKTPITNQEQLKQRLAEGKRKVAEERARVASQPVIPIQTTAKTFGEFVREQGYNFPTEVEKTSGTPFETFKTLNKKLLKSNNTTAETLRSQFRAAKENKNIPAKEVPNEKTQTLLAKEGEVKVTPPVEAKSVITSEAHTVEDINGKKVNLKANDPLLIENNKDGTYQVHDGKDFTVTLKGLDQIKGKFSTEINIAAGGVTPQMRDKLSEYIPDSLSSWLKQTATNSKPTRDISSSNGSWESPTSSTMNTLNYVLADRNIDLRDVTKAIEKAHGILTDQKNASLKETLFSGRLSSRIDDFVNNELRNVTSSMAKNNITLPQIEEYMHARHAEEANDYLDSLPEDERKGNAGISTDDAKNYLDSLDLALKEKYEKVALMLDKITHKNAQLLVDYGLESQETIDKWFSKYKHYVPLFREDIEDRPGTGQGFTIAGAASKGRTGSERKVVHILSNIAMQRERTLTRGEKNRVSQSLVSLAENFPNEDFWKVIKIPRLSTYIAPGVEARIKDNVVVARIKDEKTGEIKHIGIQFNEKNDRAIRMAHALKNLDMDTMGEVLGTVSKITRYVASINTQYNPVFGLTNFFRDLGTGILNLSSTPLAGKQKQIVQRVVPNIKGIWSATRGDYSSQEAKDFKDFQENGGQTGYKNLFVASEERAKSIESELKSLQAGKPRRFLSNMAKVLSDYNTTMENSVRLSAYQEGIKSGMTKEQSAALAKNLTVNFNKKGQIAGQAGALYAFFNASVQGAVRMYETLSGPTGKKIIAGGIILGAVQAMMLAAAGFKDNEPPEFVKERNIIIPIGGKKYITFPMPLGFNAIPNVGRFLAEVTLSGGKDAGQKMSNLLGMIAETFNPMGSSGLSMQTVAPTFLDPFAALAENKDWTGRPIYKEDFNALNPTPGTSRVKDSATIFGRGLAWAFNILTGGDKYTPGLFSPTPDQIDYLSGQITGGLGREIGKTSMMFESLYTGEELPTYRLPLT
ncbi:MAG: LPD38 domain-containing protein, partial [Candidatus Omnitrophota bacterium]